MLAQKIGGPAHIAFNIVVTLSNLAAIVFWVTFVVYPIFRFHASNTILALDLGRNDPPPYYKNLPSMWSFAAVFWLPCILSILYHLAETKHGFCGLKGLREFEPTLLHLDRAGSLFAIYPVLTRVLTGGGGTDWFFALCLVAATTFLALSEFDHPLWARLLGTRYERFIVHCYSRHATWTRVFVAAMHCLWHVQAFYCLAMAVELGLPSTRT
jgi:hypothetical protein